MTHVRIEGWSGGEAEGDRFTLQSDVRHYTAKISAPDAGTLILDIRSPRPLRLWVDGTLLLDEGLSWRDFQREVLAVAVWPAKGRDIDLRVEIGDLPRHPAFVEESCPSRNRAAVMAAVERLHPDTLSIRAELAPLSDVAAGLRFVPTQFWRDDVLWQHLVVRQAPSFSEPPSSQSSLLTDTSPAVLRITSEVLPFVAIDGSRTAEREHGVRRFHVPVASAETLPPPLREIGTLDDRPEPCRAVTGPVKLSLEGKTGRVGLSMPVYEALGRLAPRRAYLHDSWPNLDELFRAVPQPVLPTTLAGLKPIYDEAWSMLLRLRREADPASGLPADFLSTGSSFTQFQFVWDTCFTAMSAAYGFRALPVTASLDLLYSRQFDGGYIHRQHDVRDGSPALFEPDFSPNPPLLAVTELKLARLTGDLLRLARVYPALVAHHRWLAANRRLPDGTYWTTGLASGLDNAPSLGEAYPDLTAQMAHDAEALATIATKIGRVDEAAAWQQDRMTTIEALNARCWNAATACYAAALPDGGHNPNKIVSAFWPLWAGAAPPDKAAAMADHAEDPDVFGRLHPLASLAADSPAYDPGGRYWLGSVWPPTNYVAFSGLARAGHRKLARQLAVRHLEVVAAVYRETGRLWENYAPDAAAPGSWSGPDFGWSALGPIALLIEVVLGLDPNALTQQLDWFLPEGETSGVKRFPLGPATIDLSCRMHGAHALIEATTDSPFTLAIHFAGRTTARDCPIGTTRFAV